MDDRSDQMATQTPMFRRILIIRLSAVGDVIRTLPALAVLRESFPSARIAWVVEEGANELLSDQPELDEVIVFPRAVLEKALFAGRWVTLAREAWRFVRRLRSDRFDLILDFHGILKSGFMSRLSGAPVRVGFERGFCREGNQLFNNKRVSLPWTRISRFERNLRLLAGVGLNPHDAPFRLHVSPKERHDARAFFENHGLIGSYPVVALHPGTSEKTRYKRWFPEGYARVGDHLVREMDASIIVTWGPGERMIAERVQSLMRSPCVLSCPTRSLKALAAIYQHCHLYIGGDTGPMHLASLVGIPVVGIYGPTDHVVNAPYNGTPSIQVRKDLPCSPCRDRNCPRVDCLKAISHEDVAEAARDLLERAESVNARRSIG